MKDLVFEKDLWEYLKTTKKKIVVYGMGGGALKLINICEQYGVLIADFFASDEFVRGHYFCDKRVKSFTEIIDEYDDFIILLAFGVFRQEMIEKMEGLAKQYEFYAPDFPLFDTELFDYNYYKNNYNMLENVYNMLADQASKNAFIDVINYKISGKINYLSNCTTQRDEVFENIIKLNNNEVFVDLGAYNGDTIAEFLEKTNNNYKKIIAFEPDKNNFKKLKNFVDGNNLLNVSIFQNASWDKNETLYFNERGGRSSGVVERSKKQVEGISLDSINISPTTIKMDVEGAEAKTIIGAENTIKKYSPKLLVSAYHKSRDLFELPLLIKKINPNYNVYFRHHPYIPAWENCYYFVDNNC